MVGDQDLRRARRKAEGLERHERRLEEKGRRKQKKLEEDLMREKKKEKVSHRRKGTNDEGRASARNETGQGKARGRQREKMEDGERERGREGGLMRGQEKEKDQKKTSSGRVHKREVRIPKDQQDLLSREEFLLPDDSIVQGKELMSKSRHPYPPPAGKYDALGL